MYLQETQFQFAIRKLYLQENQFIAKTTSFIAMEPNFTFEKTVY